MISKMPECDPSAFSKSARSPTGGLPIYFEKLAEAYGILG